jgi:hypothetical protein
MYLNNKKTKIIIITLEEKIYFSDKIKHFSNGKEIIIKINK